METSVTLTFAPFPEMFLVQDGDLYFTGEWSRDELPAAYLGCLEDAAHWETREEAQAWADEFGGTVVEIDGKTKQSGNDYKKRI